MSIKKETRNLNKEVYDSAVEEGLPAALIKQLTKSKNKKCELLSLMKDHGDALSVNEMIVLYYKKTGEVFSRGALQSYLSKCVKLKKIERLSVGIYKFLLI